MEKSTALMTFEEAVKLRMKDIVAELIPEEKWTALVDNMTKEFINKDLPALIKSEMAKKYKEEITKVFERPEWREVWDVSGPVASEAVRDVIIKSAPEILAALIGGAVTQAVSTLRNNLHQGRTY